MKNRYLISCLLCLLVSPIFAQDESFLYGKVYTIDDKSYEGPIRWGKEEVYWVDIFNASKEKNRNIHHLSPREREALEDRQHSWGEWSGNWGRWFGWSSRSENTYDGDNDFVHQFACQFGDIKMIKPSGRKYVDLELRNGTRVSLSGDGYNDIGTDITIMDPELGQVELDWGRIDRIEFVKTPASLPNKFGKPLYGTVEAYGGKFTGFIQWDHDERLSSDKLDGDTNDGDLSIEFGKIKSIERRGGYSFVTLKSGRELRMDGSNDVSNGNRGVIVMNSEFPSIDIPWDEFDKVTFTDEIPASFCNYDQFSRQQQLTGVVTTSDGKSWKGKIVYDLDEEFNFELLQGKSSDIEFTVSFREIKRIDVKSEYKSSVTLRSGRTVSLGDAQDVNERNQGVLIFVSEKEPTYVRWEDVRTIEFQ